MTQDDLNAIRQLIKEELEPIRADMAELKQGQEELKNEVATLKEGQEELRTGVNTLLEWADRVSDTYQFPLPAIGE